MIATLTCTCTLVPLDLIWLASVLWGPTWSAPQGCKCAGGDRKTGDPLWVCLAIRLWRPRVWGKRADGHAGRRVAAAVLDWVWQGQPWGTAARAPHRAAGSYALHGGTNLPEDWHNNSELWWVLQKGVYFSPFQKMLTSIGKDADHCVKVRLCMFQCRLW